MGAQQLNLYIKEALRTHSKVEIERATANAKKSPAASLQILVTQGNMQQMFGMYAQVRAEYLSTYFRLHQRCSYLGLLGLCICFPWGCTAVKFCSMISIIRILILQQYLDKGCSLVALCQGSGLRMGQCCAGGVEVKLLLWQQFLNMDH